MSTRFCSDCAIEKPLSEFRRGVRGRLRVCKSCHVRRMRGAPAPQPQAAREGHAVPGVFVYDSFMDRKTLSTLALATSLVALGGQSTSNAADHCDQGQPAAACQVQAPDPKHIEENAEREQAPTVQRIAAGGDVTVALTGQSLSVTPGSVSPTQTASD